jgi:hypothetical protein
MATRKAAASVTDRHPNEQRDEKGRAERTDRAIVRLGLPTDHARRPTAPELPALDRLGSELRRLERDVSQRREPRERT